ncbi:MAG: Ig domain-containing protein, partial [Verrucomicrobia bacterium]|nr:Ig domain-containing protein [Verrucomicrobiota bacterium]
MNNALPLRSSMRRMRHASAAVFIGAILLSPSVRAQAVATWNGEWPPAGGAYNTAAGADRNAPVSATVDEPTHTITLHLYRAGTYDIYRKLRNDTNWGVKLATTSTTTYADTTAVIGVAYEYKFYLTSYDVSANTTTGWPGDLYGNFTKPYGYIIAGINVDTTAARGRVVLVVTSTITNGLPAELETYKRDLAADGWTVDTINVTAATNYSGTGNLHQPIRTQIQALNTAHPGEIKNIILFGKVPVPRSGSAWFGTRIDGHSYTGAETADAYYADMDGTWTDTITTDPFLVSTYPTTHGVGTDRYNAPGDGKFDFDLVSEIGGNGKIEFGLGRIDFSLCGGGEIPSTRSYLNKLHRYKTCAADYRPGRKAAIREGFDSVNESGWMAYSSLLGPGNIVAIDNSGGVGGSTFPAANPRLPQDPTGRLDPDGLYTTTNGPFLFYSKGNDSIFGIDTGSKAVFCTGYQSLWGWWAENSGIANRCAEQDNLTLSWTWQGWSDRFFYHRLAFDGDMGDVWRTSLNNVSYNDAAASALNNYAGNPPPGLYPYTWSNSTDSNLVGVVVDRSSSPYGPWTRLTPTPIVASTYTDTSASAGEWTYSVRAVKLETTGSGTYLNPSIGATITVRTASPASTLAIATTTLPAAAWQTTNGVTLTATGGNPPYVWTLASNSLPAGLTFAADGTLAGKPLRNGTYQPVFRVTDYRGTTTQAVFNLNVAAYRTVTVEAEADSLTLPGLATYNYGIARTVAINSPNKAFLRFTLPALTNSDRLIAARLRLSSDPVGLPLNS